MTQCEEGFVTVKQTVEKIALSRFGNRFFTLAPFQAEGYGALMQLRLNSGETINLRLSRHELFFYPSDPTIRDFVDSWIKKRIEEAEHPSFCH
jgi:hypothetical protein